MAKDSTRAEAVPVLLQELWGLLMAHRPAFGQERTFWRAVALVFGELFGFARHTVTQSLLALGLTDGDWSGWYRLFSRRRFEEEVLAQCLFRETLQGMDDEEGPYVVGVDGVQVPRSSQKMPGTSWLKAPGTAPFRFGIHRAQRFVHGAWLVPQEEGYSRAIPLRFLAAFPEKAIAAEEPPRREWEAGLQFVRWLRGELNDAGRARQPILVVTDGAYDVLEFWKGLPEGVILATRTARNRRLYQLPERRRRRGRPPEYGERVAAPAAWLQERKGWQTTEVLVRGRMKELRFRVEGPVVREGLPECPMFLIVVRGMDRWADERRRKRVRRDPAFYLVSAVEQEGTWRLPLPIEEILGWLWQRWELEVAHREMKSGLGVGEKQCWNRRAAVVSVQWSVWVYAVLLLAGYRTWGLIRGPASPGRWWPGARRWSLNTLWRGYRAALWGTSQFRAGWSPTNNNWLEKEAWVIGLHNAVAGAARN